MAEPVSLKAVVETLESLGEELFAFLNPHTGDLVILSAEDIRLVEDDAPADALPEWQQKVLAEAREVLASDEYLELPTSYDIHEYAIMEEFCSTIAKPQLRHALLDQIHGSGAFRRFKQAIHRYRIAEDWYRFRTAAVADIASRWLDAHQIAYRRDVP